MSSRFLLLASWSRFLILENWSRFILESWSRFILESGLYIFLNAWQALLDHLWLLPFFLIELRILLRDVEVIRF